jgi:hypothetical protein
MLQLVSLIASFCIRRSSLRLESGCRNAGVNFAIPVRSRHSPHRLTDLNEARVRTTYTEFSRALLFWFRRSCGRVSVPLLPFEANNSTENRLDYEEWRLLVCYAVWLF